MRLLSIITQGVFLIIPFHAAAWHATAEPIRRMINIQDDETKIRQLELWRTSMQDQLATVGITSALIAGVVASAFTWSSIPSAAWSVKAVWYTALLLALAAICTAAQQTIVLSRLATHPYSASLLCSLLSNDVGHIGGSRTEPGLIQLYIWQIPISLLNGSVYFFIAGLGVLLWDAARVVHLDWSKGDTKVVTIFMIALGYVVISYTISTAGLYNRVGVIIRDLEERELPRV